MTDVPPEFKVVKLDRPMSEKEQLEYELDQIANGVPVALVVHTTTKEEHVINTWTRGLELNEVCSYYYQHGFMWPADDDGFLEHTTGDEIDKIYAKFGHLENE